MKKLTSIIILTAIATAAINSTATTVYKTAIVSCKTKLYTCWRKTKTSSELECGWIENSQIVDRTVRLRKDDGFPNPQFPFEVWRGQMRTDNAGHDLTMNITYSNRDALHPLEVNAQLADAGFYAETSGTDRIDIGLRVDKRGRGYFCPSIRYQP